MIEGEPSGGMQACDTCGTRRALFVSVIDGDEHVFWCVACARKEAWPFDTLVRLVAEKGGREELSLAEQIGIAISVDAAGRTLDEFYAALDRALAERAS